MLKIFQAIVSAMKSGLRFCGRLATAPLRLFGGGGGDLPEPPPLPGEGGDDPIAARERAMETGMKLAAIVTKYAATCVINDRPAPLPAELTPALREWCRGLSKAECLDICGARPESVSAHIQGVLRLPGVRRVSALQTAEWKKEAPPDHDDASFKPLPAFSL